MENNYWELVSHPERLYIADQSYEYGRKISLVPGIHANLSFLKQQKAKRDLKVYAVSLNLQHLSQAILSILEVADIFDEGYGASWDFPSPTKEEILLELQVNGNHAMIIGDAIGDIIAGKSVGVKAIAIVTGPTPYSQLLACKPDTILTRWLEKVDEIESVFSL